MDAPETFQTSVAYLLGSRDERFCSLLCPSCAVDRFFAIGPAGSEIVYVQTIKVTGGAARCAGCGVFPLILPARELLRPQALLHFMGSVLKMAEAEAKRRTP